MYVLCSNSFGSLPDATGHVNTTHLMEMPQLVLWKCHILPRGNPMSCLVEIPRLVSWK